MVIEDTIPVTTGIEKALLRIDFRDTFAVTNHKDSLEDVANLILTTVPKRIMFLFQIRNFLVKFLGLKVSVPEDYNTKYKVGGYIGFFKIHGIDTDEIILGGDDKHLNFRMSIYNSGEAEYNIKVTTLVQYQNIFGKVYMFVIKPFHRMVVRTMLKSAHEGCK